MPYQPAKRTYRRKPKVVTVAPRRRKLPLNKQQTKAVNSLVKKQMYSLSETKTVFAKIDHSQGISLDGEVIQRVGAAVSDINQIPMPADADALNGRDGNSIQPIAWKFDGHMTIPGSSSN